MAKTLAGSQKQFELVFKLSAALGSNFNKTFKSAVTAQKQMQDSIKSVNRLQTQIDGYNKTSKAVGDQKTKLAGLNNEHDKIVQKIKSHKDNVEKLQAKINATGDASGQLTAQLVKEKNEVEKNTEKLKRNESQIQQTTARIEQQKNKLNNLGQELQEAGVDTERLTEENQELRRSYDKLIQSQDRIKQLDEKQQKVKASIADTKTELLKTTGAIGAVAAAVYVGPVKAAMGYQTAMKKVETIADTSAVPINTLGKQITELSSKTGIAAADVADDVYNAISAGQKTADAVNFVNTSTKLAKAGFAQSAQTLDVLTTVLNAYGKDASEATNVSDMLIQTQNKGKVTVAELASSMGKIIPTANASNVSFEQLCAGYAIMTSKGIKAAETTTYMNSMLNELSKSGTIADKTLRDTTGKGFSDLMKDGKNVGEVLVTLQEEAKKQGKTLSDMFGSAEAGKAAVSLLSDGIKGYSKQVQGMVNSSGATEKAFNIMEQSPEGKIEKAKNAISNLQIVLGQQFLPVIGDAATKVTDVVAKLSNFASENPKVIQTVLKVVTALAGLKVAGLTAKLGFLSVKSSIFDVRKGFELFKGKAEVAKIAAMNLGGKMLPLGKTFKSAVGPLGKLGALFGPLAGVAGKILPVVGIATALIAVFKLIKDHLGEIREFIGNAFGSGAVAIFDKIVAAVGGVSDVIKNIFSDGNIGNARNKIQEIFGEKGTAVFDGFINVVKAVKDTIGILAGHIVTLIVVAAPSVMAIIQSVMKFAGKLISVIAGFAAGLMPIVSDVVMFLQTYVLPVVQELFEFVGNTVLPETAKAVQALLPVIMQVISTVIPAIQSGLQTIWGMVSPIIQKILSLIKTIIPIVVSVLKPVIAGIANAIGGIATALSGVIQFVTGVFTGDWKKAWEGIKNIFSGVFDAIKSIATGVIDGIKNLIGGIADKIKGLSNAGKGKKDSGSVKGFARGTASTPETFIAGENGPELITNAPRRVVYTAAQTERIFAAQKAAKKAIDNKAASVKGGTAPKLSGNQGNSIKTVTINNTNNININGDKPDELEEILERNNEKLLQQVDRKMQGEREDERRTSFA